MRRLKDNWQSGKAADAAIRLLKQALDVFKDTAGSLGVPGLQAGVTLLSAALAMIQKSHANTESIKELAARVGDLTKMVNDSAELHGENTSALMKGRVERLVESWKAIDDEAEGLKSRNKLRRILESEEEGEKVTGLVQKISWSIQSFMVEGMLAIEFSLDNHADITKQTLEHVEEKLDDIRNDTQYLRSKSEGSFIPLYARRAQFDGHPERKTCLDGTRTEILDRIFAWAAGQHSPNPVEDSTGDQPNILWLNGLPGAGKTTIACSVAERCNANGTLGASFFCSRSDSDCNNASMIFTTIAYHLGVLYEPYQDQVSEILKKDPRLVYAGVSRQFEELVVQPLKLLRDGFPPCVVIIDALDECRDAQVTSTVLSTLLKHAEGLSPIRFFVTSRPERHIVTGFDNYRNASGRLLLHKVPLDLVTVDIKKYFAVSLSVIKRYFNLAESWPDEADIETLSRMASGLFIFAATAIKFIEDRRYNDPAGQLKTLMSATSSHGSHQLLDQLYLQVLDNACPNVTASLSGRLKTILGSIAVIKDPLPPSGLSRLLRLSTDTVYSSLVGLHSVLVIPAPQESDANINVIHPTFPEFLLDPTRCTSRSFVISSQRQHTLLLHRCLDALKELRRDICNIRDPSMLNIEVPDLVRRMKTAIPAHLKYACRHWCVHLLNGELSDEILDALLEFVQKRLLHWIEACSLLGVLRDAVSGVSETQRKLRDFDDDRIKHIIVLLNDCERLIVGYFPAISGSALQLYYSVLSFIPRKTMLARTHASERFSESSVQVLGSTPDTWDACMGTVSAHGGRCDRAVDFSPDDRTIVSSGEDNKIYIWDALTSALHLVLSGHSHTIRSVNYSPDGARIASAANDETVRVWDAASGVQVCTLEEDESKLLCVIFAHDGRRIVSGSDDGSIKIWDAGTGAYLTTLTVHNRPVESIAMSRDGRWMASGSEDQVYLWSLEGPTYTRRILRGSICGYSSSVALAFTPDSSELLIGASTGGSWKLSVWDTMTAKYLRDLRPSGLSLLWINDLSLSLTGNEVACGADNTILVLDITRGDVRQVLSGHTDRVTSVAYSQDGTRIVSGSRDGTVRLWDATQSAAIMPRREHASEPMDLSSKRSADYQLVVFSPDASRVLLASRGSVEVVRIDLWGRAYKLPSVSSGHSHYAAFSPDDSTILTASLDYLGCSEVELWDAASGSPRVRLEGNLSFAPWDPSLWVTFMWSSVLGYTPHCFGG